MRKITYRSFESARKFAQKLGLKNRDEWKEYCKSGNNPDDIPASAGRIYKKDFKGWGDFLGTGNVKPGDRQYRLFEDARDFARKLKLKGTKEWQEYCKSGNKPDDIPGHPGRAYPQEFKKNGKWGDWLGTGTIASQDIVFRSFEEAREFARSLKLKDNTEWKAYCKSGSKPDDIPANPNQTYKNEFKGIPDWLANENLSNKNRIWLTYEECQQFAQKNNITIQKEWENFSKSGKRTENVPGHPQDVYKKEWKGWGTFLGTNRVAYQDRDETYLPWPEAKIEYQKLAKKYGLKNGSDFAIFFRKNPAKLPKNIPANPQVIYTKERIWKKMKNEKTV